MHGPRLFLFDLALQAEIMQCARFLAVAWRSQLIAFRYRCELFSGLQPGTLHDFDPRAERLAIRQNAAKVGSPCYPLISTATARIQRAGPNARFLGLFSTGGFWNWAVTIS